MTLNWCPANTGRGGGIRPPPPIHNRHHPHTQPLCSPGQGRDPPYPPPFPGGPGRSRRTSPSHWGAKRAVSSSAGTHRRAPSGPSLPGRAGRGEPPGNDGKGDGGRWGWKRPGLAAGWAEPARAAWDGRLLLLVTPPPESLNNEPPRADLQPRRCHLTGRFTGGGRGRVGKTGRARGPRRLGWRWSPATGQAGRPLAMPGLPGGRNGRTPGSLDGLQPELLNKGFLREAVSPLPVGKKSWLDTPQTGV